jgi:hypothetical protein
LVKVDPVGGSLTLVADLNTANSPQSADLTSDPTTHRLFAIRTSVTFGSDGYPIFTQNLLTIDSRTGTLLASPQFNGISPQALVFDTSSHTLFGVTYSGLIVKVDPTTATLTTFAPIDIGFGAFIFSLALSVPSHTLYLSREDVSFPKPDNPTKIVSIDTVSGVVSSALVLDAPVRPIVTDGSALFGITDNAFNVVGISTSTGGTTFVGNVGSPFNSYISAWPTSDSATHTIFVDVATFDPAFGFQDHMVSINDQTGATTSSLMSGESLVSIAFEAPPAITPESIKDDVRSALANGSIDNAGVATSLLAKLNAAADARARSTASGSRLIGCSTAANIYQAFIDEVTAQSASSPTRGHISAATASQLVSEAQFLIANCP